MQCENPDCKTTEMKPDYIKITRPGGRTIYYCSQWCFSKKHKIKFNYGKQSYGKKSAKVYINWGKINMGGL